eukprot:TRINITY_DN5223_c0_g1_i1.p1 TRINITY_DN5223_c0_g1~~TRINITY_DN5223_c0_g1_i1.p1  ORF type:complete len:154 (-),score=16.85 TRINITY_DN5223_c0_g1_i1:119-580(-)
MGSKLVDSVTRSDITLEGFLSENFPLSSDYSKQGYDDIELDLSSMVKSDDNGVVSNSSNLDFIKKHYEASLKEQITRVINSGVVRLDPSLRFTQEGLKGCSLNNLIELKVALGNLMQCLYSGPRGKHQTQMKKIYESRLTLVDKQIEWVINNT